LFLAGWTQFKVGFGCPSGDFWMGNDRLHELTKNGTYKIRFDLLSILYRDWYYAEYTTFIVGDESTGYQLTVDGYSGTAGDSMTQQDGFSNLNGMPFATYDYGNVGCATNSGAFWQNSCSYVTINADTTLPTGFGWAFLGDGTDWGNLQMSRMILIPK